jgi:hypothetical protein
VSAYPLYPNALRSLVNILEGLDAIDAKPQLQGGDPAVQLKSGLEVINADDSVVIGWVKDDVGGAWHFEPNPAANG